MTAATTDAVSGVPAERPVDFVTITVDGVEVSVPKGTLVIRAAELVGIQIPRFCDHPLLDPVGACRQCLVEVEGQRKPLASCTTTVADGMVVKTQLTSPVADKAQHGVMELLLINHPLDCPVCDKGGECPLQNQAMTNGRSESRFEGVKRTYEKPINISTEVLLDRERCVLCARCTRFSQQIAGDPFIELLERGALQQVGIYENQPFESYFSGNTIQICPVGALTSAAYRFRSRPFDLVSTPTTCEHCASGCSLRADHRRGKVMRRLAWDDPEVNEEWNCDKGRFAFNSNTGRDRLTTPQVRGEDGQLRDASWPEALSVAAVGLLAARGNAGVLVGGRVPFEDAYAYSKFARIALQTNDIDFRARPASDEEADFIAARVAATKGVSYRELEAARTVLLVGFEPEEESPIVFLRLRKATRAGTLNVFAAAPFATRGLDKMSGSLIATAPGAEAELLSNLNANNHSLDAVGRHAAGSLREPGAVILVGERLAQTPGGLSAVAALAKTTGAALSWIPRRAGERGAIEAGALPNLLPGGRPITDAAARAEVAAAWGVTNLPDNVGRDAATLLRDAAAGRVGALVIGGVELNDLAEPAVARAALESAAFVVSLEVRESEVTQRADVVLPVAPVAEKPGMFVNWEGRVRPFERVLASTAMTDVRVLNALADEIDLDIDDSAAIRLPDHSAVDVEAPAMGPWTGERPADPTVEAAASPALDGFVLATWRHLLDDGRAQDREIALAGTAQRAVARLSVASAASIGAQDGALVDVSTTTGSVTVPLVVTEGMVDGVVWLPSNSSGINLANQLGAAAGSAVSVAIGGDR